jgi:hypothetical protein
MFYPRGADNIFEELLTDFTFKIAYMGLLMMMVFTMGTLFQNMPIHYQKGTFDPLWCLCKELAIGVLVIFWKHY